MIPPSTSATSCFCPPSINTSVPTWHLTPGGRWKPVRCARWETTWCRSTTGRSMSSTWRKTTQSGLSSGMIIDNRYCLQTIVFKIKLYSKHKPLYFTWIDMLLVKGPLCSKQIGTFCSKDMLWVEASLLHGTEREICWLDMLLVKDPLCSKQRGTFCSKDMLWVEASLLHGTDREICWIHVLFYSKMKGTDREICSTDMLLVGGSLFHGSEREICWIVTLQKGTKRELCSTDMLWVEASERNVKSVD